MMAAPTTHNLSRTDTVGVALGATVGLFSMACVFVMFLFMFYNITRERHANPSTWRLIKEPIDIYVLILFIGDLIQGLGHVLNIRWVHTGIVVEGAYCTAQGSIRQFGATGVAMTTLVIAVHSFVTVLRGRGEDKNLLVAWIIMAIVWLYVLLFVVVGITVNANKHYIIPDPFWCWISPHYPLEQLFGEYLWFWITLAFSFLTYVPLYFISRGNIKINGWRISFQRVESPAPGHYPALGILAYPIVYSVLVLPLSIARWRGFNGVRSGDSKPFSPAFTLTADAIFVLSGAFNVLLLLTTRQDVLLFSRQPSFIGNTGSTSHGIPFSINQEQGRLPDISMHLQTCPTCKRPFLGNDPPLPPPIAKLPSSSNEIEEVPV